VRKSWWWGCEGGGGGRGERGDELRTLNSLLEDGVWGEGGWIGELPPNFPIPDRSPPPGDIADIGDKADDDDNKGVEGDKSDGVEGGGGGDDDEDVEDGDVCFSPDL
jgi:hypothetical protein